MQLSGIPSATVKLPIDLPMRTHALTLQNMQAYGQRMKARYYAT